jgi:hypothetical protein
MARIRTVKPAYWDDEVVGMLPVAARLLFIASWNLADDEGLLRWSAPFIKASVFKFDDDLDVSDVQKLMDAIAASGMLFEYVGGKAAQRLAYVVNFRRHQKINRPGPGMLPPPPVDGPGVLAMYARRDEFTCACCREAVAEDGSDARVMRLVPRGQGGTDYPTNMVVAHLGCEVAAEPVQEMLPGSVPDSGKGSTPGSVSHSVNPSQNGNGEGGKAPARAKTKATRIPEDFAADMAMVQWAQREVPNIDGSRETANFIDYWTAASGPKARKDDWVAAWRYWMRNADPGRSRRPAAGRPAGTSTTTDRVQQARDAGIEAARIRAEATGRRSA